MATHFNGISALQLQSQLRLGSYRTAWMLCAKLRRAMVDPDRQPLRGIVEADGTTAPRTTRSWCQPAAAAWARCRSPGQSKSTTARRDAPA
jgi:hypothetical protein